MVDLETDSYQMLATKFLFDAHHYTCASFLQVFVI